MTDEPTRSTLLGNRYAITAQIGSGGMGAVFVAADRLAGQDVALKQVNVPTAQLMFSSRNNTHDLRVTLAQEFRTLASLRHPNIISVLDYGFDDQRQPYYTMELLHNAQDILTVGKDESTSDRVRLLTQMFQALAYLHRRGIIHRDLKPENVMVVNGQVKLLDFGLAAAWEYLESREDDQMTGTLPYIAPEVMTGMPPDVRADLYAAGLIAYELFAGRYPFPIHSVAQLIHDIMTRPADLTPLDFDPGIQQIVGRLVAKSPRDRYASAADVIEAFALALDQTVETESPLIRESFLQAAAFIGRERELEQLHHALTEAQAGKGSAWLIGGESGVGKSRLLDELRTYALVDGMIVLRSQGVANASLPYVLWREPVRRLLLSPDSAGISAADAAALKQIVPDIEGLLGRPVPDAPELEGRFAQQRMVGAIVSLFWRQTQPVAVLMDDLQWALESLDVLKTLVGGVGGVPLLIAGNYRDDEAPRLAEQLPDMQLVKLERFDYASIARLSQSMLGEAGQELQVIDLLERQTEGNVFFLIEVVRALAEEAGRLSDIGKMTLPERIFAGGIHDVVMRRLNKVPERARPLLRLAAAAGRQLDLPVMRRLAGKTDLSDWLITCGEAVVLESAEGEWRFAHDKLREGVLSELPAAEIADLHRQVARAMQAVYPDVTAQAGVLAYHWRMAGDENRELHYAVLAGQHQLRVGAHQDSAHFLSRALELLPPGDHRQRALLQVRLGEAHQRMSSYDEAQNYLKSGLALAQALGDGALEADALRQLGSVAAFVGDMDGAKAAFAQCLTVAEQAGDGRTRAMTLGQLSEMATNQGQLEQSEIYITEALSLSQALHDAHVTAILTRIESKLAYNRRDYDRARSGSQHCLTVAGQVGDRYTMARARNSLGVIAATTGDYDEARTQYMHALKLFQEIGDRWGISVIDNNMGFVELLQGRLYEAAEYLYRSLEHAMTIGILPVSVETLAGVARVLVEVGEYDEALGLVRMALHHPATTLDAQNLSRLAQDALRTRLSPAALEAGLQGDFEPDVNAAAARLLSGRDSVMERLWPKAAATT